MDIAWVLDLLTSGSSLRDLAGATPQQIEARLSANCVIYDTATVSYLESAACDMAAEGLSY
jgi:hypothetical protein